MQGKAQDATAIGLMSDFAERTGLTGGEQRRYLWTDAFAVRNYLALFRMTGDERYRVLATDLVDAVHHVLGRHRPDDPRDGWLSGLPEAEGARHPTRGGLRIGKPLPERAPEEPEDERLEWDRDGQYFHYLTKWMDALAAAASVLRKPDYHRQAVELAEAVLPRFLRRSPRGAPVGLAWKMSVDLSRPLVRGTSPHDALDGYVTLRQLAQRRPEGAPAPREGEGEGEGVDVLRELASDGQWATADPLGLGGLLLDAVRLAWLPHLVPADQRILRDVLAGADAGVRHVAVTGALGGPASRRLAFRELGLAIGLQALPAIAVAAGSLSARDALDAHLQSLSTHAGLGDQILEFWSDARQRDQPLWREHRDINEVMLATALLRVFAQKH